jgi:hypothetical protein
MNTKNFSGFGRRGGYRTAVVRTEEEIQAAARRYQAGHSLAAAGKPIGVSKFWLADAFKSRGIALRHGSQAHRRYTLNDHAFDDAASNPEAAYWAGVLLADGCVVRNAPGQARIHLSLAGQDADHVEAFRQFVGAGNPVSIRQNRCGREGAVCQPIVRVSFSSIVMASALARYGIGPRKSLTAEVSGGLEASLDFWRGVTDGDGSLGQLVRGQRTYPTFDVCGSLPSMRQFVSFAADRISRFRSNPVFNGKNNWRVRACGETARLIISLLYGPSPGFAPVLARKGAIARRLLDGHAQE